MNPIWSPTGDLIVYAGPFASQVPLFGIDPTSKAAVALPLLKVRNGGYRFLPGTRNLVILESTQSLDFTMVDLRTGERRQLTKLGDHGLLPTFDITPDGKQIVFDRTRDNSNIALIELAKR